MRIPQLKIRIRVEQPIGEEPKATRDNFAKYDTGEPMCEVLRHSNYLVQKFFPHS
jgi:hypothetical protein